MKATHETQVSLELIVEENGLVWGGGEKKPKSGREGWGERRGNQNRREKKT